MRIVASSLLTVAALAAAALPVAAQDDEAALPVTVITNAEFCDLLSEDPIVCEGIITGMATAGIVPEAFATLVGGGGRGRGTVRRARRGCQRSATRRADRRARR